MLTETAVQGVEKTRSALERAHRSEVFVTPSRSNGAPDPRQQTEVQRKRRLGEELHKTSLRITVHQLHGELGEKSSSRTGKREEKQHRAEEILCDNTAWEAQKKHCVCARPVPARL